MAAKVDEDFPEDIASLPIAQKAMRALRDFLDVECGPSATLSPTEAAKLRELILDDVRSAAKNHDGRYGKAATITLSRELLRMADGQGHEQGALMRECRPELLESLAEMFAQIASPRKKKVIEG